MKRFKRHRDYGFWDQDTWMIPITPSAQNGLTKKSSIDCFQVRSVSATRLLKQIGKITFDEVLLVQEGIVKVLGYEKIRTAP